jgi:hypothetical protein
MDEVTKFDLVTNQIKLSISLFGRPFPDAYMLEYGSNVFYVFYKGKNLGPVIMDIEQGTTPALQLIMEHFSE